MKNFVINSFIIFLFTFAFSCTKQPPNIVTPDNALTTYLNNKDNTYQWEVQGKTKKEGVSLYRLILTSQTWRDIVWKHELYVIVPDDLQYNTALLYVTGGNVKDGEPIIHKWDIHDVVGVQKIAQKNKAITALLCQVPNQPLYDDFTEDGLISYTLDRFQHDNDYTWPLLFAMTKSAIRAMDAIQEFAGDDLKTKVNDFVVTGMSKRGWTTWLTGANDKRVIAIAPMVIDMLNMPVNILYHKHHWGDYTVMMEEYTKYGITQILHKPEGEAIVKMVDPYSYRKNLTMPKMIFNGTNDRLWPVDAIKNYIDSIPGDNHLCYIANARHDLGDESQALNTVSAFFGETLIGSEHPKCDYSVSEKEGLITLTVATTSDMLEDVILWISDSDDRDFRDEKWMAKSLGKKSETEFDVTLEYPDSGYEAFYIDLKYKAPFGGSYTQSTRIFLADSKKVYLERGK